MKDFINKFQKDVKDFQKSIQFESDELVKKLKTFTAKSNLDKKRKMVERVVRAKVNEFEPAFLKFVKELKQSAAKAGIDLNDFEAKVQRVTKKARDTIMKQTAGKRSTKKKAKTAASATKKKATTAKAPVKTAAKTTVKRAKASSTKKSPAV